MNLSASHLFFWIFLALLSDGAAIAQIIPDNSLGTESSQIRSETIKDIESDVIEGGATRRSNLFHSFREFSIKEGRGAYFANPAAIENIFTRVTGGNVSNILGTLGVLGNANLFLINPNGIIFGSNARLDVRGAFIGSTADSLIFDNNFEFSATNPDAPPLLTLNIPIGLRFREKAGNILAQGSSLEVQPGKTLTLAGGNVTLEGVFLAAPGGRIEIGSIAGDSLVKLNPVGKGWASGYEGIQNFGNILLSQGAFIDVSGEGGGDLQIQAARLDVTQGSYIFADTLGSGDGGEVLIRTTEAINLKDSSWIRSDVSGSGTGGDLTIKTGQLIVEGGTYVSASTYEGGQAGNLTVNASEFVELIGADADGFSSSLLTETYGDGDAGDLTITTGQLTVRDGAEVSTIAYGAGDAGDLTITAERLIINEAVVSASTNGKGDAGDLLIRASDSVELNAPGGLFAQVNSGGIGSGGNLSIETQRLSINNGAGVSTATFNRSDSNTSEKDAGNLTVRASESVEVRGGSGIYSATVSEIGEPQRDGGDLTIETGRLNISDGAQVASATIGGGNAGDLLIRASDFVDISEGTISTETGKTPRNGGNLTIETGQLTIRNGSQIRANTSGEGQAGTLTVNASKSVELISTGADDKANGLFTSTGSSGDAGDLKITTGQLSIRGGSVISASTLKGSQGQGGILTVAASEFIELSGTTPDNQFPSGLLTQTLGSGNAGDLTITTPKLLVQDEAQVSGATSGTGRPGNIFLRGADSVSLSNNSSISTAVEIGAMVDASAEKQGGNIDLQTRSLSLNNGAEITASTAGEGDAGKITITADTLVATGGGTIQTNTASTGKAGDITLNLRDSLNLSTSAIEASTAPNSTGKSGNITIDPITVTLTDGARISVNNQGLGDGGNISLFAQNLTLQNRSSISATTASGEGGNITFNVPDTISQRNNSPISATAGGTGNGGNITIKTQFLIGNDNSDITANAFEGTGGNINITADGIFWNPNSEITASSQLGIDGVVQTDTPEVDPSRGLINLPQNLVDPNALISQNACRKGGQSEFTVRGRGGLPSTPEQVQSSNEVEVGLVGATELESTKIPISSTITTRKIIPAQGWRRNVKGDMVLVAYPTADNTNRQLVTPANCSSNQ